VSARKTTGATPPSPQAAPVRIGISACILGQEVRFNGGHKLNGFIRDTFGQFVDFVPICPEVDIGLGVPRETLRLVKNPSGIRLVAPKSEADHTKKMKVYAKNKAAELATQDLCGFIVQKGSPSCGMERVKIYPPRAGVAPAKNGRGLFTAALMERLPFLPVEEDGRLNDPALRENFVERVFAYRRLKDLFQGRWSVGNVVQFHANEKLLLMAHDPTGMRPLGRLVAGAKAMDRATFKEQYQTQFLACMAKKSTVRKHMNVLQHIAGYFRRPLDTTQRDEVHDLIESYRAGQVPLVVPMTIISHQVRRLGISYLADQSYLNPHPRELMLRNHV